jgi:hypothetical protein
VQREADESATLTSLASVTCCLLLAAAVSMAPLAALGEQPDIPRSTQTTDVTVPVPRPARREWFGALAFTADGSFASAWKFASKKDVEAKVLGECAAFNRGRCEVVSLPRELCAAIATYFAGTARKVTYAGAGLTSAEAEHLALERCNSDQRSDRKCQVRTVLCADGR